MARCGVKNRGGCVYQILGVINIPHPDANSATISPKCDRSGVRDTYIGEGGVTRLGSLFHVGWRTVPGYWDRLRRFARMDPGWIFNAQGSLGKLMRVLPGRDEWFKQAWRVYPFGWVPTLSTALAQLQGGPALSCVTACITAWSRSNFHIPFFALKAWLANLIVNNLTGSNTTGGVAVGMGGGGLGGGGQGQLFGGLGMGGGVLGGGGQGQLFGGLGMGGGVLGGGGQGQLFGGLGMGGGGLGGGQGQLFGGLGMGGGGLSGGQGQLFGGLGMGGGGLSGGPGQLFGGLGMGGGGLSGGQGQLFGGLGMGGGGLGGGQGQLFGGIETGGGGLSSALSADGGFGFGSTALPGLFGIPMSELTVTAGPMGFGVTLTPGE